MIASRSILFIYLVGSALSVVFWIMTLSSCSFNQKIKNGETAYERKQYAVAIELLEAEIKNTKAENMLSRKAYLLGQSYMKVQNYPEAQNWFNTAAKYKYGGEALIGLARASKYMADYSTAIEAYKKLGELTGRTQEAQREIQICIAALDNMAKPPIYKVSRLVGNTQTSEYAPVIYDDNFLVFTSERPDATGKGKYLWTGEKFSDLFIMPKSGSEVRRFDSQINSNHNDGTAWFAKSMDRMYFTRCFTESSTSDDHCILMMADRQYGIWGEPEVMPFIIGKVNYGHPTLIENDSILVFSADLEEPGGSKNLYYSELFEDGSWSIPEKMPPSINSPGNEVFPTGDGDTLYFSSDFWPGQGGYDIFKTYLNKDKTWTSPINMGFPINSGADDFSFIVDYSFKPNSNYTQQGYFVSSREGMGKDDLYSFKKLKVQQDTSSKIVVKETNKLLYITVKTFTPQYIIEDDPNSGQKGKIPLGETLIKIVNLEDDKTISTGYADVNGFYYTLLPLNTSVKIIVAKLNYLNATDEVLKEQIVFLDNEASKTINKELLLDKIYVNKEINLQNIYYDFDKWDIKNEAKPTLDALVKLLNDNPQINIQLASHTDCRGGDEYNQELSQKRAQSAVEYLVSRGVDPSRLLAKGFGKSRLIDLCDCGTCTEDQHQINRRTTFAIMKK